MKDNQFLVEDYTNLQDNGEPTLSLVWNDKIFEIINKAKRNGDKIVVFELIDCLIDWS